MGDESEQGVLFKKNRDAPQKDVSILKRKCMSQSAVMNIKMSHLLIMGC